MPNRILKETIKSSEQIDTLTWFEEVVFYRLMVTADDYGCLDGRPILLKNELFPTRENVTRKSIEDAVSKLVNVGLLIQYEANGKPYLFFPTWEKHQRVRNKHRKFPNPFDNGVSVDCLTNDGQMSGTCMLESNPIQSESNPNPNPNICTSPTASALVTEFEILWELYPKKQGKKRAFEAYCRDRKKGAEFDVIRSGVEAYGRYIRAEQTDYQYIKQGDTFFAQAAWESDWTPKRAPKGTTGRDLIPETEREQDLPF